MKKICEYCKKEFETENKRVKYCSKECKAHVYSLRRKEKSLQPSGKYRCLNCGKDFDYISGQGSHRFCTSNCKFTYIAALGKLTKKLHAEQDPNYAKNVQNRRRNTCLQRYGVDHVAKSAVIKQKTHITNLKKYKNAIDVWTRRDPLKRKTAKENNLNWLEFFTIKDFEDWFNLQKID